MQSVDYASMRFAVTHVSGNISLSDGQDLYGIHSFMKEVILIVLKSAECVKATKTARSETRIGRAVKAVQRHFRLARLLPVSCRGSITNENSKANSESNISRHTRIIPFPIVQPHPFPFSKRLGTSRARQGRHEQGAADGRSYC